MHKNIVHTHLKINRHGYRTDLTFHTHSVYQGLGDISALHNEVEWFNLILSPDVSGRDLSISLLSLLPFWVNHSFSFKALSEHTDLKKTENSYWFLISRSSQSKVTIRQSLHLSQTSLTYLKDDYKTKLRRKGSAGTRMKLGWTDACFEPAANVLYRKPMWTSGLGSTLRI